LGKTTVTSVSLPEKLDVRNKRIVLDVHSVVSGVAHQTVLPLRRNFDLNWFEKKKRDSASPETYLYHLFRGP